MSNRIQRVESLIQEELGKILLRNVEFSAGVLVTITRVEASVDLANARVYIGVLPQTESKKILGILNKIVYALQKTLNKRLRMRPIPKIRFIEEKETGRAARVEELLEELKKEEK